MSRLLFFLRLFSWFSLRQIRKQPGRTLTVLLGLALGAAVFTSVRLAVHASLASFTSSIDAVTGQADMTLVRPGGRVSEHLVSGLVKISGVVSAAPVSSAYVKARNGSGDPFLLIGIDPIADTLMRGWEAAAQPPGADIGIRLISTPRTLLAGHRLADELGLRREDAIYLEHTGGTAEFTVIGILSDDGLGRAESGRMAVTDISTYQELTGQYGLLDRIDIKIRRSGDKAAVSAIQRLLPDDVIIRPPTETRESGRMMIKAYQLNLSILSFASLFVGMFLVFSLVALNAASRRKEIAIVRALGAGRWTVFALFLSEGAFFGIIGWTAAIPVSAILVRYLIEGVGQTISTLFVRVTVDRLILSPWEILLSFAVTVAVSVIAALQPAREAMAVPPKETLGDVIGTGTDNQRSPVKLAAAGMGLIAFVVPLAKIPSPVGVPVFGYLATILLFIGFALIAPWGIRYFGNIVSPLFHRAGSLPATLAARYLVDSGMRTAVSVGALITAVALFASLVIMVFSFRETVKLWVNQSISGDLFVSAKLAEVNRFQDPMTGNDMENLRRAAQRTKTALVPIRRFLLDTGPFSYQLEGMDLQTFFQFGGFIWLHGDPETGKKQLVRGKGVVVSEVFSNRTGLSVGDRFTVQVSSQRVDLPVVGIVRDYRTQGGVVYCDLSTLASLFEGLQWTGARFFARGGEDNRKAMVSALRKEITRVCGDSIEMVNGQSLREEILRIFDETFAVTSILLLIALTVAALGIAATLTVLVLERMRELNTLLAVGASRWQIRSMIAWESLLMVAAGEIAGLACGFILSYLLVYVINRQSFGWTFLYGVDWQSLSFSLPLVTLAALGAAVPAIRIVFRQSPAEVLRQR